MELELTRLFVKVVQHGGFSKAATALKIPKSTVSKAVSKLERDTGTQLLLRTTRSQSLTASGRAFYETCVDPLQILEEAQKSLFGQENIISGKIKLTAPEDLGAHVLAPVIGGLCLKYPKLEFELHYTNEIVDLVRDGFDFGVRLGELKDSSLKRRKIGDLQMIVVTSPAYLKARGEIKHPDDLKMRDCLTIATPSMSHTWALKNKSGKTARVRVQGRVTSNQTSSLYRSALKGGGVALLPYFLCKDALDSGELIRVLSSWCGPQIEVSLVSPVAIKSSSRLHLVTSEIIASVKEALSES